MPNRNGKGPEGIGPTGRGLGGCNDDVVAQTQSFGRRASCRNGRGRRMSCCIGFNSNTSQDEKIVLKANIKAYKEQLNILQQRLDNLEKQED